VAQHVVAKRYLATVDEDYTAGLARASRSALRRQGGTLSAKQVARFESNPWAGDAVALRRFDDAALCGEGEPADPTVLNAVMGRAWTA
jgi:predicted HD phosphohydrolase